nr:reverse transcriptase domain-containing protein [Tanacetum cinerariifolium]
MLVAFKEMWIVETCLIEGVPKLMRISSFMDAHKCLELANRYSNKVPKTVDEMILRLDDFVRGPECDDETTPPLTEEQIEGHLSALRSLVKEHNSRDPTKITKEVRKANEMLVAFKEMWIVETCLIEGVPKIMRISSFMDAHKCLELANRYSNKVPKTMDEMILRLDDFVRLEKAFANTELLKGEIYEASRKLAGLVSRREN